MPKTNCPLYNKGLYVEKINQTAAHISMCCFQTLSQRTYDTVDFYANDYLNSTRIATEDVPACAPCVHSEKHNHQSYRIGQQKVFDQLRIPVDDSINLISLTYNCENTCNLKCITCGPRYSSLWKPEYKKLKYTIMDIGQQKTSGHHNKIYKSLPLDKIKIMHFQGGEPLLTDDHINVLHEIEYQGGNLNDIILSYNTNGTIFPSDDIINLWKKTKLTKIYFSIDAIGDQFNYIRYPANWKHVEENLFRIRNLNLPNLWIEIGVTVSIANLFYIGDIIKWKNSHFSNLHTGDPIRLYTTFAEDLSYGGAALNINSIDKKLKQPAISYLNNIGDQIVIPIINKLKNSPETRTNKWEDYLTQLDLLRDTNWKISLSKLLEHYNA
jgi:sulfatase maturation enzyme AslB (radical SAM superfamily)